ncbi:Zinc finger FYVE/PHD-type [Penicillium herquei]|nr:Zinc finger FYVE/PHD-type [Penicillium herquei]
MIRGWEWDEDGNNGTMTVTEADFATVCNRDELNAEDWRHVSVQYEKPSSSEERLISKSPAALFPEIEPPTLMFELQQRFFFDFIFLWKGFIDDPFTWKYSHPVFRSFSRAFLCLAAWDFEVTKGLKEPRPSRSSFPEWKYPENDVYWFHGVLVILNDDISSPGMIDLALEKGKGFVDESCLHRKVRCVLLSPMHTVLCEIFEQTIATTKPFPLVTSFAREETSPGFRLLAHVFSTNCFKSNYASSERFCSRLPREILLSILQESAPKDTVALAQASFKMEELYYASLPQLPYIKDVENMFLSVPCCWKRINPNEGVVCCQCLTWQHRTCIDDAEDTGKDWTCLRCQEGVNRFKLKPAGIYQYHHNGMRTPHFVLTPTGVKALQLPVRKPQPRDPFECDFAIRFNHIFSGLGYKCAKPPEGPRPPGTKRT